MRRIASLAALLGALGAAVPAAGDGGVVRLSERTGDYLVTIFTSPTPLRAGPIDISVLVQQADGGGVVGDAAVRVSLRSASAAEAIGSAATRAQATNKLLYAALLDLPSAGNWQVDVTIERPDRPPATVAFAFEAAPPLPPWRTYWPYFALPPIAMAVYALHQWLLLHRGARGSTARRAS